jgi:hypothetical protein
MISENTNFTELKTEDPKYDLLIQAIVDRSQGVFLWVFLVMRSLMRGLANGDTMDELQMRLRALPQELEPYFEHMINSIEDIYRTEMAELLQIALLAVEPYPLIVYHLLREENMESWSRNCLIPENNIISSGLQRTKKRINARCQDLLQIHAFSTRLHYEDQVDFLHRTVKDFLQGPEMTDMLLANVGQGFKPNDILCQTFLKMIQTSPQVESGGFIGSGEFPDSIRTRPHEDLMTALQKNPFEDPGTVTVMKYLLRNLMYHARKIEESGEVVEECLDEVQSELRRRPNALFWIIGEASENCIQYALDEKLYGYCASKIMKVTYSPPGIFEHSKWLRGFLMQYPPINVSSYSTVFVVHKLINSGSNMNLGIMSGSDGLVTPWMAFLDCMFRNRSTASEATNDAWFQMAEMLIKHGADPNVKVRKEWDCRWIFNCVFDVERAAKLVSLLPEGH